MAAHTVASPPPTPSVNVMRGFNPYLHGARGLFALMIVFYHVVNSSLPTFGALSGGWPLMLLRTLTFGVELFFGVSGVVIVGALSRARGPLIFAIERGTRIYPVLWVSVLAIAGLGLLTHYEGRGGVSAPVLIENLLALPPLLPGPLIHPAAWSLSYELCFYFFCALAWVARRRIGGWAWLLILPAAAALLNGHVRAILMPVGMLVAVSLARSPHWSRFSKAPGLCLVIFLVAWGFICDDNGGDLLHLHLPDLARGFEPLAAVVAVASATAVFVGVLGGRGWLSLALKSAPFQFLGTVSYSLYLWHPVLMSVIKRLMYVAHLPARLGEFSQLTFLLLALPPSLALAWASQEVLEKRVTKWLRRRLEHAVAPQLRVRAPETTTHSLTEPTR